MRGEGEAAEPIGEIIKKGNLFKVSRNTFSSEVVKKKGKREGMATCWSLSISPVAQKVKSLRLTKDDFEVLKVIGRGAFGEVAVVKQRNTEKVYAMKILNKWEMLKRAETACFQEEREVLVYGDKRWITNLHFSFQDDVNLYLVQSNVAVGTPDYISPEILRAMEDGKGRYGAECDWWSLGVCMYEMLYGETPFYAESLVETYGKIMNHKNCFDFPDDPSFQVSEEAKDLMRRLICSPECRLGQNGLEDFKNHPWFIGVNWATIRETEAPYIPEVSSPSDTSNFDVDEPDLKGSDSVPPSSNSVFSGLHLPFVGFTFSSKSRLSGFGVQNGIDYHTEENNYIYEQRIQKLEHDKMDLQRRLREMSKFFKQQGIIFDGEDYGKNRSSEAESRKLQDEINTLRKRKSELEMETSKLRKEHRDMMCGKQELDSLQDEKILRLRELEKALRFAKAENDELHRDLIDCHEKLKLQAKDLKDALGQRKLAMTEYAEVSDKLSELRAQKQKLSRQVRDKEEELETAMQKIDILRQDLRKAEKFRREFEARIDEAQSEATKERRLRERTEEYAHHLEDEMEALKQRHIGRAPSPVHLEALQEVNRLKMELERMDLHRNEALTEQQARHHVDITALHEQLREADLTIEAMEREIMTLKEKIELTRSESTAENNEILGELKRAHDKEKNILQEENRKLELEVDKLTQVVNKQQEDRHKTDDDINHLKDKNDSIAKWESQVSEIIQWVSEEKDARSYLQALAIKMTEELENIKSSGLTPSTAVPKPGGVKKGWMRQFVVVCDFKLFLYDLAQDKSAQPYVCVSQVLDMRDEDFSVNSVLESDVIHANRKDIPCIFRITTSMMDPPGLKNQTLMLVDRESEKNKWVDALTELHRILRRNKLPSRTVFQAKEILDNTISIVKNALSAAIIDRDRIVLGTEEGLYCVDLDREEIARIGDGKKISQIQYVPEEQLLIAVSGKQRHIRLIPVGALDGHDVDWIKVVDTKGCLTFDTACYSQGCSSNYVFCIALKRQVVLYDINRTKIRHQKRREICLPTSAQCLNVMGDRLCIGFPSSFYIYSLWEETPPFCLVNTESTALSYLCHNPMDALIAVNLPNNEFLLVFSYLGIFVDGQGRKTRDKELMFPALPTGISQRDEYLCVYSESHIDIFEVSTGDWVQTVNLKKTKPLSTSGMLCLTLATELPHMVYLHNVQHRENQIRVPEVTIHHVKERSGKTVLSRTRRRFSVREPEKIKVGKGNTAERRSRMISAPTNFNHVSHMGPGEGIQLQKLMDLPAVKPSTQQCQTPIQTPTSVSTPVSSDERSVRGRSVPQPKPLPRALQDSGSRRNVHNGSTSNKHPSFINPWNQRPPGNTASPDGSGSVSSQEHSTPSVHTAGSAQAHSSGHEVREAHEQSSPRHSIASNTSSNVSYPPSPRERRTTAPAAASVPILPLHAPNAEDHGGSSSYESQS
ncbi:hypothetical protein TNIN_380643 [Trichonephila inaurata madagascariensis]|uniref:non-specific serine/threonine protein kinase n=1 Tax=Trichonephila inaurata madagascariensis TaxID=2747483 RepID=A0A8X6IPD2_9ARAC|nr:hypothetical protein TNIN_380643 [Trichonephila inaurata madagascariensis]